MLSKIITTGTTTIKGASAADAAPIQGRYYGYTMSNTAVALSLHDCVGTAAVAIATNGIDYMLGVTGAPVIKVFPKDAWIPFWNGLHALLGTAGTATIYYE